MGNYDANYGIFISWNVIQLLEMTLIKVYNTTRTHLWYNKKSKPEVAYYGHSFINKRYIRKDF